MIIRTLDSSVCGSLLRADTLPLRESLFESRPRRMSDRKVPKSFCLPKAFFCPKNAFSALFREAQRIAEKEYP